MVIPANSITQHSADNSDNNVNDKGCLGNETALDHFMACEFLFLFILTVTLAKEGNGYWILKAYILR